MGEGKEDFSDTTPKGFPFIMPTLIEPFGSSLIKAMLMEFIATCLFLVSALINRFTIIAACSSTPARNANVAKVHCLEPDCPFIWDILWAFQQVVLLSNCQRVGHDVAHVGNYRP